MTTVLTIFAAFLTLVVARIIIKIVRQHRCPEDTTITDYFRGRLKKESALYDQTVAHFGVCQKCRDRLAALSSEEELPIENHLIDKFRDSGNVG